MLEARLYTAAAQGKGSYALPEEFGREEAAEQAMADLLRSLATRSVPTGRLLRLWSLGTLQARSSSFRWISFPWPRPRWC